MPGEKEKEVILHIIELYKEMPCLWDKTHKDYHVVGRRYEVQRVLLDVYKTLEPKATIKHLNKKIHNLRTNYTKEFKKVKESAESGAAPDDVYVPKLYYFDALSFLGSSPYSPQENTASRSRREDPLKSEKESSSSSDGETTLKRIITSPKKKRLTESSQERDKMAGADDDSTNHDESWELSGRLIGMELRDLEKNQRIIIKKLISELLYYAQLGRLTHDTYITLGQ